MQRFALLLIGALLSHAAVAMSDRTSSEKVIVEFGETSQTLPEQRAEVMAAFEPGERFAEMDAQGRQNVMDAFDRLQALLGPAGTIAGLSPEAKVLAFNEQSLINELLTQAARDSRITCKRQRAVNSRIKSSECHTVAAWTRKREEARDSLDDVRRTFVHCVNIPSQPGVCD